MNNVRGCFSSDQYNEKSTMCTGCPNKKECKESLKRRVKSWLVL